MLTADDVLRVRFAATRLRHGYDQVDVDDLLDHVVSTLRHGSAPGSLTAADVGNATLRVRSLVEGYDVEQVDAFLAQVRATLAEREARVAAGVLPVDAPFPAASAAPAAPVAPLPWREVLLVLVLGVPPVPRPGRPARVPRAPRTRSRRVTVGPEGVTWTGRSGGHLPAAEIARVVLVELLYGRDTPMTWTVLEDRSGVARLRVMRQDRTVSPDVWAPLRVPVERAPARWRRPKDARRTWPEAFGFLHAYPYSTPFTAFALFMVVGWALDTYVW